MTGSTGDQRERPTGPSLGAFVIFQVSEITFSNFSFSNSGAHVSSCPGINE